MPDDSCDLLCLDLPQAEAVRARLAGDVQVRVAAARVKRWPTPPSYGSPRAGAG